MERLGPDRAQRRVLERLPLPGGQGIEDVLGQVERDEQPRPRALEPLLGDA
ncbi:MAG: hypothetical protein ACRDK9_01085 [Solirubrobacterales bacterium]